MPVKFSGAQAVVCVIAKRLLRDEYTFIAILVTVGSGSTVRKSQKQTFQPAVPTAMLENCNSLLRPRK